MPEGGPAHRCEHVPLSGKICGRRCYTSGACWEHRGIAPTTPCLRGCGRRTRSFTRYCRHCGGYQTNALAKVRKDLKAMDEYVAQLLRDMVLPEEPGQLICAE